ncbi:MAG: penicillin-binding protein 2 [Actinomycetota bacterium]
MTEGKTGARLKVLAFLCAFMFAALGTRLWFVQVLAHAQLASRGRANSIREVAVPAPRGRILDRHGNVLARNRTSLIVTVNRQALPEDSGKRVGEIGRLADVLGLSEKTLASRIDTKRYYVYTPVPVAFDVPKRTFFYLGEHRIEFPGVAVVEDTIRDYLQGPLAPHVLGYVGPFSPTEAKDPRFAGYGPDDVVGKSGVELAYEQYLRGRNGMTQFLVNSVGKNLGPVKTTQPKPGDDVYLTLDEKIQKLAVDSLDKGMKAARTFGLKATHGAVIVMDPSSGAILALASNPSFDPNWFATGNNAKINEVLNPKSEAAPTYDRATQAVYPPGSTFKPFIALSALRQGFTSTSQFIPCPGTYHVPGTTNPPEIKSNWETVNNGSITLAHALVISCDTVFYQLGWDNWVDWYDHGRHDKLQTDLRSFGFGRPTGLDLPNEGSGLIPDAKFKAVHYAKSPDTHADEWQPGDFLNMSIGQGDVGVTPIQLATAYSALANGGTVYRPHVLEKVKATDGSTVVTEKPRVNGHLPFTRKQMDYVRQALTGVVGPGGTASSAFATWPRDRIPIAAKTGTAEVSPFEPYSWFAAMAPANDPQYVVVSLVEQGGHGSQSAAPIVRRILDGLFGLPLTDPITGTGPVD